MLVAVSLSRAANCPPGKEVAVEVNGPSVVEVGGTAKYTCTITQGESEGGYAWLHGGFSGSSSSGSITLTAPSTASAAVGDKSVTCTYTKTWSDEEACTANGTVNATIVKVEMNNSKQDFSYQSSELTINLSALVTPAGITDQIKDQCSFTVGAIGSSTLAWDTANPGGKPTANAGSLEATVKFSDLPDNNSDFGSKTAIINYLDNSDSEDYKVFYEPLLNVNGSKAWYVYHSDGVINSLSSFEDVSGTDPDLNEDWGSYVFTTYNKGYFYGVFSERLLINRDSYADVGTVGDTVAHEFKHQELVRAVDAANFQIQNDYLAGNKTLQEAIVEWAAVDSDGDWVLDSADPNIGQNDNEAIAATYGAINWLSYIDDITKDWTAGGYNQGL